MKTSDWVGTLLSGAQLAALIDARDEGSSDGIGNSNISARTPIGQHDRRSSFASRTCSPLLISGLSGSFKSAGVRTSHSCPLSFGVARGVQKAIVTNLLIIDVERRLGATPAQIAVAWLLGLASCILLIPGTRTHAHLTENIGSGTFRLGEAIRSTLTMRFPSLAGRETKWSKL
jgi:pyridoxine 4-dehydrogenase